MEIKKAVFHSSSGAMKQLPDGDISEFAFVGRSNVGKSSLINMLCNNKGLAKTSSTPGKTQTVNLFLINEQWYLADLPGYGYAKVNKNMRQKFQSLITDYLSQRKQLKHVFVLIDGRISPQKIDMEFAEFLIQEEIPYTFIITKTDKAKQKDVATLQEIHKQWVSSLNAPEPAFLISSSAAKKGKDGILDYIESLIAAEKAG